VSALAAASLALLHPGVSRADCGGVETSHAAHHPRGRLPPLAIGDSTLLLSLPGLAARGFDVNAQGCRQWYQALGLIAQLKARGRLPHMVVIFLGANGYVTHDDIGVALGMLCCTRVLVLVTPRQLGGAPGENAVIEHEEAHRHPGRILLLDWVKDSAGHPDWFQPDRLHLTWAGVAALNRLIAGASRYAYPHKHKHKRTPVAVAVAADQSSLAITTSLATTGYVAATVTGPAGASVQVSEQGAAGTTPIGVVQLSSSGTATIAQALTWRCDVRARTLIAATLPPAAPANASATVTTPSCAQRLQLGLARRARVGASIAVRVTDRWGIGGLPLTVCTTPPGSRRTCIPAQLAPGQGRLAVAIPAPRPGGWRISVETSYGFERSTLVWASHPGGSIRLLAAGDSEMQILDGLLARDLAGHGVNVTSDARISTGLSNPFFFNWPAHAAHQAPLLRPDVTVLVMGANEGYSVTVGGHPVACCGAAWSAGYANLVARMMRTYLRGAAGRVYWFLLAAPRPANFRSVFDAVNAGVRAAAARFPGRVGLIDANSFFTPGNRYRDYMVYQGHGFTIHESDGIHLSAASDAVAATMVTRRLVADHVIR
jgi:lysophospholipase L1-like esterase